MKRLALGLVGVMVCFAACWKTRPNPRYCDKTIGCADTTLVCDQMANACVPPGTLDLLPPPDLGPMCTMNTQCTGATAPICGNGGVCRACTSGDCMAPTPICVKSGSSAGACVQCAVEADCAATHNVCSASGSCVACTAHSQCGSGVCEAGQCVDPASIAYVDIGNCATTPNGRPTTPYCQVDDALLAAPVLPYVKVNGSATVYNAITVPATANLTVTIVGPGKTAATQATFSQNSTPSLEVAVNSAGVTLNVVADGLELRGAITGSEPGALCSVLAGAATLSVLNALVDGSGGAGISSSACTLNASENYITNNHGGVSITGGTYDVENNLIYANTSTAAPGVTLGTGATGTFSFNTVAYNTQTSNVGGVICLSSQSIANSIVFGNSAMGGTQFSSTCTLSSVVTGTDSATGATMLTPTFMNEPTDVHLTNVLANQTCCIDKVTPSASTPKLDVDGTPRPQNNLDDLGGHEVRQ